MTFYLGASLEVPEGPGFEDDPVPLAEYEGHHGDHHHQQKERRQDGHDPQVAGRRLYHSCEDTNVRSSDNGERGFSEQQSSHM